MEFTNKMLISSFHCFICHGADTPARAMLNAWLELYFFDVD